MMHERGKSDSAVVATKPANKAERSAAEGSGRLKGAWAALRPRGRVIGRAPACGVPNDAFCPTARKRANSKKTTRGECCGRSAFPSAG
jgi:hypothetical protein